MVNLRAIPDSTPRTMLRTMMRRFIWILVGILGALVLVYLSQSSPLLVDTATLSRGPLTVSASEDGVTRIRERYEISTPLMGRLLRITHDVGDIVKADETVVARLEPPIASLLDPRAVAQAKARVMAAERRLEIAKLQGETSQAEAEHAESERIRLYQLRQQDAVSDAELKQAELEARLRADARRTAQYAIEIADYELELERAALLLTSSDDDTQGMELEIRAPIDGRVLRILQENSAVIAVGTVLMEVGDPHDLELIVDVLSRDAVKIKPGANVTINRWGGDTPLHGQVRYVEPSGFTKFSALGVEEQRVNVVIDLQEPAEQRQFLGDAFRVEADITLWHSDSVLRIPTSALYRIDDRWAAFFIENSIAIERELTIGQMNDVMAEVIDGAGEGETVIAYPSAQVRRNVRVRQRLVDAIQ